MTKDYIEFVDLIKDREILSSAEEINQLIENIEEVNPYYEVQIQGDMYLKVTTDKQKEYFLEILQEEYEELDYEQKLDKLKGEG